MRCIHCRDHFALWSEPCKFGAEPFFDEGHVSAKVLNSLPARCTPLLMMDVNGKLGRTDINSPPE
jgi:hypothetical protein